jgi:F0F1-type ATP synthase assembly protein I
MPNDIVAENRDSRPAQAGATGTSDKGKFRGPLRYEIETSSTVLEAGRMFSVFLRITNPYDVPVTILSVETQLPIEFEEPYRKPVIQGTWQKTKHIFVSEYNDALEKGLQRVRAHSLSAGPLNNPEPGKDALTGNEQNAGDGTGHADVLQPGNSILNEFTVRTRQTNLFTPSVYCFHMQIAYEMDGRVNHDTAKTFLNIKAPISAMGLGAALGAVVGTLLKYFDQTQPQLAVSGLIVAMCSSILIALVLVVAFARKKDAQPFITIEDFYGGAFVGVLAGFSGYALLHQVLSGTQ